MIDQSRPQRIALNVTANGDSVFSCIGHAKECIMARLARAEIFDPAEIVAVRLIGKTVSYCYLVGVDERSGKNFDHRKRQSWNDLSSSRRFGRQS